MTVPIPTESTPTEHGRLFWAGAVAGWAVMAIGVIGLLSDSAKTKPANAARFVVGAAVAHDLVVAPVVILLGLVVARVTPPAVKGIVQSALIVSGVVALFSYPFVRGYGRQTVNPSILPRNYATGLAISLAAVWAVASMAAVRRLLRRRTGVRIDLDGKRARRRPSWRS